MKKQTQETNNLTWKQVKKYIKEDTYGSAAMTLIETEKIYGAVLTKLRYPGKTNDEKTRFAENYLNDPEELEAARLVVKKLKEEPNIEISPVEAKEVLNTYSAVIKELNQQGKIKFGSLEKLQHKIAEKEFNAKSAFLKTLGGLFLFFFAVYILSNTEIGLSLTKKAVEISEIIFSWILFTLVLVGGILTIIITTIFYFEKTNKRGTIVSHHIPHTNEEVNDLPVKKARKRKLFRKKKKA